MLFRSRTGVNLTQRVQNNALTDPRSTTYAGGQGGGSTIPAPAVSVQALSSVDALGNPITTGEPVPESPPAPATSNGIIDGLRNFFSPPKADAAVDNSPQARAAAADRNRIWTKAQLMAKDD